ncbi:hypothetical protein ANN_19584 [Periplaneta americana]|uniref:DUF4817 domain-containing protein n=1 Tax=Periplaneta americana TaxID=6978 RepID=A0ABQ8SAB4_PERAM|nr:hypothetical protein ANN_19584 [Periplaneta americana]
MFPGQISSSRTAIYDIVNRFESTGSVQNKKTTQKLTVLTEDKSDQIGVHLERLPTKSLPKLAQVVSVSLSNRIVKLKPYKYEVWFHLTGRVNNQNTRYWRSEIHIVYKKSLFMKGKLKFGVLLAQDELGKFKKCAVSSTQKFLVQQHITTSKHQANKQLNSKQRQLFLTQPTTSNVRSEFNIDLCRSLISADIPLYKLKNKVFIP